MARGPCVKLRASGHAHEFAVIGLPAGQIEGELYFIGDAYRKAKGFRLFARARLRINGQVRLFCGVESQGGEKLSIDAAHSLARKEMIEARESLQEPQIRLSRIVHRNACFPWQQTRKRVYIAALGPRQDAPRLIRKPHIIQAAKI